MIIGRSRSQGRSTPQFLTLLLLACVLTTTACNSTTPRAHWWEFWKPKATTADSVYQPDKEILPPPPGAAGPGGSTGSNAIPPDLPPPPTSVDPSKFPEPNPIRQQAVPSDLQTIYFNLDSSDISGDAMRILDQNAAWLRNRPNFEVSIEGHCDERGSAEYNMNLGARRAKVVRDYLVTKGVDAAHLHTISYGEERPIDPGHSEAAYAKNRRVQFLVY